jgi:hypothetical protein
MNLFLLCLRRACPCGFEYRTAEYAILVRSDLKGQGLGWLGFHITPDPQENAIVVVTAPLQS